MVTVVQGKVCAKNHPDRLSRLATIHQRYRRTDRRTDGRISYGIGLDLTVGQKRCEPLIDNVSVVLDVSEQLSTCDILRSSTFDVWSRDLDIVAGVFLAALTAVVAGRGLFLSVKQRT